MFDTSRNDAAPNPTRLVAKFLLSNGYLDTLQMLADESNVQISDMRLEDTEGEQITLESLLEERRLRELSIELARTRLLESEIPGWTSLKSFNSSPLPLKSPTNVLFVTIERILGQSMILVSTADKALRLYDYKTFELKHEFKYLHSSPILEVRVVGEQYLLTAGMDGKVVVTDLSTGDTVIESLDLPHQRYVNRLVIHDEKWIATSGYDKKINLYEITQCSPTGINIEFRATLSLPTLPEGMIFCEHLENLVLVVCARDTCFLEYYLVPSLELQTRFNMNANKDLWISFSGIDISQQPGRPGYLGLSTSTTPNGRWLAFKVGDDQMQANVFHGAPQSDLGVLPRHVWRPDGSGFWVNSDDGLIRGVELKSGKVVATLRGHDSAVRTLWSGLVDGKEVLLSGSFDKSVLVFRENGN